MVVLLLILESCNNENTKRIKASDLPNIVDTLRTDNISVLNEDFEYNKAYVLSVLGAKKFNLVREGYKQNLYSALDMFKRVDVTNSKNFQEIKAIIDKCNIPIEQIKKAIPISPTEFKIYDSCFSNNKQNIQIENFERVFYELACNSGNDFADKEDFIVLYTNMYSIMYVGILLNEERVGDGYYFYAINTIISKNSELFCKSVWAKTNDLVKSKNGDLYPLYECRCKKNVLDEFDFCE